MYARCFKRVIDFILALVALIVLFPIFLVLVIVGAIAMGGNPFFVQPRVGLNEKVFNVIKFRTMTNAKDSTGSFLPDLQRKSKYGDLLRKTSLDELPQFINILRGDMSLIGPRPLLVRYIPFYTEEERHRHDVRPGVTGWAQVNGRNFISWEEIFRFDIEYVTQISLLFDIKIFVLTIKKVLFQEDITDATQGTTVDSSGRQVHNALDIERSKKDVI